MASIRCSLSPSQHHRPTPPSLLLKPLRQQQQQAWRRSIFRVIFCFLAGVLLGLSPFADLDDSGLRPHDFSFGTLLPPPPPSHHHPSSNATLLSSSFSHHEDLVRPGRADLEFASSVVGLEAKWDQEGGSVITPPGTPKLLIIITPTYNRALQSYFLNRLGQTLRLVRPPLLWVVVETKEASEETAQILRRTGVMYRHLLCKKRSLDPKDRGVLQRNTALKHIKHHHMDGIIYFADDDNIYSLQLFERIREIRRFGTWPVAMLTQSKSKAILEGPVCNGSQVIGWKTNEKSKRLRRFHIDMSGFAFNSTILWDPKKWSRPTKDLIVQLDTVREGFQETTFIAQVVEDESQMEGIPPGCSRIMNWHLHLEAGNLVYPSGWEVQKNLDVILPLK